MNQTFEVRQSRPKVLWGIVVCIVFVATGLWLTTQPDTKSHLIGWGTVVFFGSLAPTWVATMFNPGRLIADSRGLTVISPFSERRWDWADVEAVQVWKYRGARFVQLKLKEPRRIEGFWAAHSGRFRALRDACRLPGRRLPAISSHALKRLKRAAGAEPPPARALPSLSSLPTGLRLQEFACL